MMTQWAVFSSKGVLL